MFGDLKKHRVFFAVATFALFSSFAFNVFGAMPTAAFVQNFKDSEALVVNQIRCRGQYFSGQMLELKKITSSNTQEQCNPDELKAYSSQFGLQGRMYTWGYRVVTKVAAIEVGTYVAVMQLLTALASAVCLALFALWVRSRFGRPAVVVVTLLLALSPMLVGFGRNLYWALPLLILPFVYALYAYDHAAPRKLQIRFWGILALLLFIRYLCGYEYITTITIMILAAISFHLFMLKSGRQIYIKTAAVVLAVSLFSFLAAFTVHVYSLKSYAGSTGQAFSVIKKRALERTARSGEYLAHPIAGLRANLNDVYVITNTYADFDTHTKKPTQFWASLASMINYAFMPVLSLPVALAQPFATYAQSLTVFVAALILLYVKRASWVRREQQPEISALFLGAATGFVGLLSWLVLARSHSLVHGHINGILLYLPFALFGFTVIGIFLDTRLTALRRRLKK